MFVVVDLISQASAIEKQLAGRSDVEIISWLECKGQIEKLKKQLPQEKQLFRFNSYLGMEAIFFVNNGQFFFIGDHSVFRPKEIFN